MRQAALDYRSAGLSVLPARPDEKKAVLPRWKDYQTRLPTADEVGRWFRGEPLGMCIITGAVSGNLEVIDFDCEGEMVDPWIAKLDAVAPGLSERLVVEETQSGGWHVVYRCEQEVNGNLKLAQRKHLCDSGDEVVLYGKIYVPRQDANGQWHVILTLIETRGEGGLFLCAPTPGYAMLQGDFARLPVVTADERETMLLAAHELSEYTPEPVDRPSASASDLPPGVLRPGDDYAKRGDVRKLLRDQGWVHVYTSDREHWRRPGKRNGTSATYRDGWFYVFSTSAEPFDPLQWYSSFAVYTLLEHHGDFHAAASALRREGYGQDSGPAEYPEVDLSGIMVQMARQNATEPVVGDPKATDEKEPKVRFTLIPSKELAENAYDLTYLIDGILVRGQPGVIAGPKKALKTNISIDLALSLSHAGLFLGRFDVPVAVRVGVMSGESGAATIQETARRIAVSKHSTLADFSNAFWSFEVPQLGNHDHTQALRELVTGYKLDVLILDPTYLMMLGLGDSASNLFAVGSLLKSLGDLAQETGCTPLLCHHLKKGIADPYEPAELENIAWAGFQEFVRQWILLNRRVRYDPDNGGHHELWMSVGGSAGHSGLWGVNIDEGTRQDPGGRIWQPEVVASHEAYTERIEHEQEAHEQRKERQEENKQQKDFDAVLDALDLFPGGETRSTLREATGMSSKRFNKVVALLMAAGRVEDAKITKANGQVYPGLRVHSDTRTHSEFRVSE